jgi:hypothetical protein
MWRYVFTDVSKTRAASIFRVGDMLRRQEAGLTTRRIPEEFFAVMNLRVPWKSRGISWPAKQLLIYQKGLGGSFILVVSISDCLVSTARIIGESWTGNYVGGSRRGLIRSFRIFLRGLKNSAKNIGQDDWCPARDSNRTAPEYKSGVILFHVRVVIELLIWQYALLTN